MTDILHRAKSLGIKFENEELLNRLVELTELLEETKRRQAHMEEAGEDTTVEEEVIAKLQVEIWSSSRKHR